MTNEVGLREVIVSLLSPKNDSNYFTYFVKHSDKILPHFIDEQSKDQKR